jgi:hypothetical protein
MMKKAPRTLRWQLTGWGNLRHCFLGYRKLGFAPASG